MHGLGHGRVREDRGHQFGLGGFERHGDGKALDHLGDFCTDQMSAEERARFGIEHSLDEALSLARRDGLAIDPEGKAPDADLMACRQGLGFGLADRRDLRIGIGAAGNGSG